ncbi:transporter substrate-binding domain-containing protein [Phreatobacter sp. AB_2022a]|uniref:transporter substrate-binding domain-containing protein n=1 Tax=Phreatobacter sp. AB_2022a TaxID=3003134 RepID=UPI002286F2F4|nr:transporter substrate-binding domain-containing protein [Phreatobacter sp. AB_2022a]MCZ0736750.1 transporter substrate-binding domain-containing protein [Phreatobacter sp. AB_2022a]
MAEHGSSRDVVPVGARRPQSWLFALMLALVALMPRGAGAGEAGAVLAPTGVLRVGYIDGNPIHAVRDPRSGALTGIGPALAGELARELGVRLDMIGLRGSEAVVAALGEGRIDMALLADNPVRRREVDFSDVYLLNPQGIAVRAASPLRRIADLAQRPVRIGVSAGDTVGVTLARDYPSVVVVPIEGSGIAGAQAMLEIGAVDGFAAANARLLSLIEAMEGARRLEGDIASTPQALAVRQGRPAAVAVLNAFLARIRADGFLDRTVRVDNARTGAVAISARP